MVDIYPKVIMACPFVCLSIYIFVCSFTFFPGYTCMYILYCMSQAYQVWCVEVHVHLMKTI